MSNVVQIKCKETGQTAREGKKDKGKEQKITRRKRNKAQKMEIFFEEKIIYVGA